MMVENKDDEYKENTNFCNENKYIEVDFELVQYTYLISQVTQNHELHLANLVGVIQ